MEQRLFSRALGYLEKLVSIPSVSGDEREISLYLADVLSKLGLKVELQPVGKRYNVVARTESTQQQAAILLTGHTDTVPVVDGWTKKPFAPERIGDRLFGLGAADQKAGIAAQLAALSLLCDEGTLSARNILVAFTPDEEALSLGMLAFLEKEPRARLAILSEPHFSPATIGWPGKILVRVEVHGKAAHGGRPQQGVNAIEEASRFLVALGTARVAEHPHLGTHPFVTLSIQGGYERYSLTVPARCDITLSKQLVPGETKESVLRLVSEAAMAAKHARVENRLDRPYYPPAEVHPDHPEIRWFAGVFEKVTQKRLSLGYGRGVCDADYLVSAGIPTISFGPSGGNTHQPDEWVSLDELLVCSRVYYEACKQT